MACTQCTCGTCPDAMSGRPCASTSAIRIRRDEAAEQSRRLDERDCPTVFSDHFARLGDPEGGAAADDPATMPPETDITDAELLARIRALEAARRRARTGMIVLGGTSSALILWHIWTRRKS